MKHLVTHGAAILAITLGLVLIPAPQAVHATMNPPVLCKIYVWPGAPGPEHDGTSWAHAYTDLQAALADTSCPTLWVAAGVYKPGVNPEDTFLIPPEERVYGGFSGTEATFPQRDWVTNVTVLSGDIGGDDATDAHGVTPSYVNLVGTNSYHVVTMDGTGTLPITSTTVLDGFTITAGMSGGSSYTGAGLFCNGSGAGHNCSPMLDNLTFSGNSADQGGAMHNFALGGTSSPSLTNVTFSGNYATKGGAMYNDAGSGGLSSPALLNVAFSSNIAGFTGGAIESSAYNGGTSSPALTNVTFAGNSAGAGGGAMSSGSFVSSTASPVFVNVTFSGNSETGGGGYGGGAFLSLADASSTTNPTFTNVTFNANSTVLYGGAMLVTCEASTNCHPLLTNVILWGDTAASATEVDSNGAAPTFSYSVVQGGCASIAGATCNGGNLDINPQLGKLHSNGGFSKTLALITGSPAIDAGTNMGCPATDQRDGTRPVNGTCDIGAVEYQGHVFADVPVTGKEWMEPWVDSFYYASITTGCGAGPLIYCPENNVTRAEMAVFLLRAKHGSGYAPPPATHTFYDVPVAGKEWMEPWIDEFYAEGITTGCGVSPLRYCPEQNVTRAEMAVFILRAIHTLPYTPPPGTGLFSDVPVAGKEWMQAWIEDFYSHGITTGCGVSPLIYCPENNTTRAEMAVFIDRAYALNP